MPWFIALALLVVPILEIYVIIQIGQVIGGGPTVALLLVESALGAWIIKREGRRAWNALQSAFQTGRMPGRGVSDAAAILGAGGAPARPGSARGGRPAAPAAGFLPPLLRFLLRPPFPPAAAPPSHVVVLQ